VHKIRLTHNESQCQSSDVSVRAVAFGVLKFTQAMSLQGLLKYQCEQQKHTKWIGLFALRGFPRLTKVCHY